MKFSALQIAGLVKGTIEGDEKATVSQFSKIEEGKPGHLSFLANPKYESYLYETDSTIVLVNDSLQLQKSLKPGCTLVRVPDAYGAFAVLLQAYQSMMQQKSGIEQPAFIGENSIYGDSFYLGAFSHIGKNVRIGNQVKIYPNAIIGDNVKIGDNTTIYAGVKIYADCQIGNSCIIQAGAVIGSDGFGFAPNNGQYLKIPQIGNVILEDHVEVGANTTIDRATMGSTIIRKGVKLDNLIQIGHNVEIGENTVIAAQTGVSGSTKIGKNCMIGGQVGIAGHITIADGVKVAGQTGVTNHVQKENCILQGTPAIDSGDYKRSYVLFKQLPHLQKKIREIESIVLIKDNKNDI